MITEVMGTEPSPFRQDLIAPLEVVGGAAQTIVNRIDAFLGTPPDDMMPEFLEALGGVADAAFFITETVEQSVEMLSNDLSCNDYMNQEDCEVAGCLWVISDNTAIPPYCEDVVVY